MIQQNPLIFEENQRILFILATNQERMEFDRLGHFLEKRIKKRTDALIDPKRKGAINGYYQRKQEWQGRVLPLYRLLGARRENPAMACPLKWERMR